MSVMEAVVRPKKWGNSLGIIIPNELVEKEGITLRDELIIRVEKKKKVDKKWLMKEGYQEMHCDLASINEEWAPADYEE